MTIPNSLVLGLEAATQGHARAQLNLGVLYLKGLGTETNNIEAFKWFTLAVKGGVAEASSGATLASLEFTGNQLKQSLRLAQEFKPQISELQLETGDLAPFR
jgi:TPR repeat protein